MARPNNPYAADGRPNLFSYATKELSQDALICWLLAWADSRAPHETEDEPLRQLGRMFLEALFAKWENYPVELGEEVAAEIHAQKHNIDVLVRLNGRYVLLIEDKTSTSAHSGQLGRYWRLVVEGKSALREVDADDVYPILLKTGNFSRRDREEAESHGYAVFDRADFLRVLDSYEGGSDIVLDFRRHLTEWQRETESFLEWTGDEARANLGWQGLYHRIEEHYLRHRTDDWGPLTQMVGGYEGLWIEPADASKNSRFAIWIEKDRISLRLYGAKTSPSVAGMEREMEYWADAFVEQGKGLFARPPKSRYFPTKTKPMCVSEWKGWLQFRDGRLDVDASIKSVKRARKVLVSTIKQAVTDGY